MARTSEKRREVLRLARKYKIGFSGDEEEIIFDTKQGVVGFSGNRFWWFLTSLDDPEITSVSSTFIRNRLRILGKRCGPVEAVHEPDPYGGIAKENVEVLFKDLPKKVWKGVLRDSAGKSSNLSQMYREVVGKNVFRKANRPQDDLE